MRYLNNYNNFNEENMNEGLKNWISTFLIMANLGFVPLNIKTSTAEVKKQFVDAQPQSKIDAIKYFHYLKDNEKNPDKNNYDEFKKSDKTIKSNFSEIESTLDSLEPVDKIVKDIKNINPVNWVTDLGNIYTDEQESNLNTIIFNYEKETSVEICVLTIDHLEDGVPISDYAFEEFRKLGIGKKGANNGILILFSVGDRKSDIEIGYGLESYFTDYEAKQILDGVVRSNFKEGKYAEGTLGAIEEIKRILGSESIAARKEWDRKKEAADKIQSDKNMETFLNVLFYAAIVMIIVGIIALLLNKRRKNKLELKEIEDSLSEVKSLLSKVPTSTGFNSKKLLDELNILTELVNSINLDKEKKMSNSDYIQKLNKTEDTLKSALSKYFNYKEKIEDIVYSIEKSDSSIKNAQSIFNASLLAYNKIKEYGYSSEIPPGQSDIDKLTEMCDKSKQLLLTNIDDALKNYNIFNKKISDLIAISSLSSSKLSAIENAKRNIQNYNNVIDSALKGMNYYKKWKKGNEGDELSSIISSFSKKIENRTDYLELNDLLTSTVLSKIEAVKNTWKRREDNYNDEQRRIKEEEERKKRKKREEEERRRRNSYSSSTYGSGSSWDSSNSSSSFSGFGGGDSGGGGASSDW